MLKNLKMLAKPMRNNKLKIKMITEITGLPNSEPNLNLTVKNSTNSLKVSKTNSLNSLLCSRGPDFIVS